MKSIAMPCGCSGVLFCGFPGFGTFGARGTRGGWPWAGYAFSTCVDDELVFDSCGLQMCCSMNALTWSSAIWLTSSLMPELFRIELYSTWSKCWVVKETSLGATDYWIYWLKRWD